MVPFDTYKTYLALKNHFSKESYDYHKYNKKTRASLQSFYKRKDRFWFEKLSRNRSDKEIENFFIANFIAADNPQNLWIGEIINSGEKTYSEWMKRQQSLSYLFKEQSEQLFEKVDVNEAFDCSRGHPSVLKDFLTNKLSIETLIIYDKIFSFVRIFDKKLKDPVWETVSLKIKKYSAFLNIDVFHYKKILKSVVLGGV
jgi:hypothetical protein